MAGADAHGVLRHPGAAEILEQENHFVLLVLKGIPPAGHSVCTGAVAVALKLFDRFSQFGAAATAPPTAFQNAGP